jgi:hypothetical protein
MPYSIQHFNRFYGGNMGYKTLDQDISFAEVALASAMENNRSLKMEEDGLQKWNPFSTP